MSIETTLEPLVTAVRDGGDWLVKLGKSVDDHMIAFGAHASATETKMTEAISPLLAEVQAFSAGAEALLAKITAATASITPAAPAVATAPAVDPATGLPHQP